MKIYELFDEKLELELKQLTNFKAVAPYNAQYLNTEKDDATGYPAIYFELLEPINWTQALEQWQHAPVRARVHVVNFSVQRQKDLLHTLAQQVFVKLNGLSLNESGDPFTSNFVRVASSVPKRYRQLKVLTMDFAFEIYDLSGMTPVNTEGGVGVTIIPST